jgi:hypothetical protein
MSGPAAAVALLTEVVPTALAPTILNALGVPTATDLAGSVAESLFSDAFRQQYPVRTVATFGERRRPALVRTGQPLDQEMIERMRSLGYVR